jgi:uncharacterized cupin superfamily protein
MHRTDTLDMFTVAYGEIYLVTDTDGTRLQPGDTAVVQGVKHAWSNNSAQPCMILGVMVHASPWHADMYPPRPVAATGASTQRPSRRPRR